MPISASPTTPTTLPSPLSALLSSRSRVANWSLRPISELKAAAAPEHVARRRIQQLGEPEGLDRGGDAANSLRAERLDLDELLGGNIGIPGDEDTAGVGELLHARGDMHIGAGGVVGLVETVFNGLDHDFTGVKADPDLQTRVFEPRHCILHGKRGEAAANRMVLMRARRAKQRHHAIALDPVDDAVVAMHGFLHQVEHGLEAPHPEFRIAQAIDQAGRIADVGEQDGQALAFAAFAAQLICSRRCEAGRACRVGRQQRTALTAEAAGGSVDMIAGLAPQSERGAAALAIVVAVPVLAIALRALHYPDPLSNQTG